MLYPCDILPSYKPIKWYKLWEVVFNFLLLAVQWFIYVFKELIKGNWKAWRNWIKANHVRIYVGYIFLNDFFKKHYTSFYEAWLPYADQHGGVHIGFHWTNPRATFFIWEHWMTDPQYSRIYRYIKSEQQPALPLKVFQACLPYNGKPYDYGQLVDMALGITNVFDLGSMVKVCSVGARIIGDKVFGVDLIPGLNPELTYPCSFNYSDRLKRVNE